MERQYIATLCVHGARDENNSTGAIAVPIYQSATFAHPGAAQTTGYDYSRLQNPTREALERTVAALEGGTQAMAFSTGMSAMATMMELLLPGDHVIASDDLYGGSVRLLNNVSAKNGIQVNFVDTGNIHLLKGALRPNTKMIFVETPTNPMMKVTDIRAVCLLAKPLGILVAVDNTFLTPVFQRPLELGADIVLHSGTKYLGGHNDTLAGFLVVSCPQLCERLRFLYKTTGACLSPFDSFLLQRGIKTLAIRMEKIQQNALEIADWLCLHKKVRAVHYTGLPSHPNYQLSRTQASGFGGMISFETDNAQTAVNVLNNVRTIFYAESLGGVESLVTYPILQTHADVPAASRETLGISDRLLRLSVGIESAEDIIADLEAALS